MRNLFEFLLWPAYMTDAFSLSLPLSYHSAPEITTLIIVIM